MTRCHVLCEPPQKCNNSSVGLVEGCRVVVIRTLSDMLVGRAMGSVDFMIVIYRFEDAAPDTHDTQPSYGPLSLRSSFFALTRESVVRHFTRPEEVRSLS